MGPGERKVLKADLQAQGREIERVYRRIRERAEASSPFAAEALAYQLHNLYCAFEELFEIVARTFENHLAGQSGYHHELLRRMTVEVEGVRPRLVPEDLLEPLDSLRAFRHFFRHAYGHRIDSRRLAPLLEDARLLRKRYPEMIDTFLRALG